MRKIHPSQTREAINLDPELRSLFQQAVRGAIGEEEIAERRGEFVHTTPNIDEYMQDDILGRTGEMVEDFAASGLAKLPSTHEIDDIERELCEARVYATVGYDYEQNTDGKDFKTIAKQSLRNFIR